MDSEQPLNHIKRTGEILWEFVLLFGVALYTYSEKLWRIFSPRPLKSLEGEIILLTGSANGIGKQIARELANKGATLVCWDCEGEENQRIVNQLKKKGTDAHAYTVDISQRENIANAAEMVRSDVGDVTIVINNAGIGPNGPFLNEKDDLLEKVFHVNILSHLWILKQFLPKMVENGHGHVVTTASIAACVPWKNVAAYAGTKHAVKGFIDSIRQEIREHPKKPDIKFTTVYPAVVQTRLIDGIHLNQKYETSPFLKPEYVGKKIVEGFRQNYEHIFLPPIGLILSLIVSLCPEPILQQLKEGLLKADNEREIPNVSSGSRKSK